MSIQISVIVWTVICFVLLMVILHNLLFKPVLKVIDERRKKIDMAREKKASIEKAVQENEKQLELKRAEHIRNMQEREKDLAEQVNAESKRKIENAQKKRLEEVDKYRLQVQDDYVQILSSASSEIEVAAKIFVEKIISHRV